MRVRVVSAADEVGEREGAVIDVQMLDLQSDRTDEPGRGAGAGDALARGHAQGSYDSGELRRLDAIQLVIAANDQGYDALVVPIDQQRLDARRCRDLEKPGQLFDGARARRGDLLQRLRGSGPGLRRRKCRGRLEVGCVFVAVGENDRVLAGSRQYVEFLRDVTPDCA